MFNLIAIASLIIILVALGMDRGNKIALVLLILGIIIDIIAGVEIYFGNL